MDNPAVSSPEDWPSVGDLTVELKDLQQLVDKPNEQWFLQIPGTMRIARYVHPEKRDRESLQDTLRLAVAAMGANSWADSIGLLYGLDAETEGESLEVRQQLAFESSGENSLNTFRQVRRGEMAASLAGLLLALAKNPVGPHRGEAIPDSPPDLGGAPAPPRQKYGARSGWEAFWRGGGGYAPIWVEITMGVAFVLVVLVAFGLIHL